MSDQRPKDAPRRSGRIATFVVFGIALAASLAILWWARKGPPKEVHHPENGSIIPWAGRRAPDAGAPAPRPDGP